MRRFQYSPIVPWYFGSSTYPFPHLPYPTGQFMGQRPPPTNFNNGPRGPQFMPPPPGMQGAFPFPPMGMHPQAMAMQHLAGMGAPMMPPGAVPPGMGAPPPHPGGGGAPANWPAAAPVPPAPIKFSLDKLTREQAFELIKQMKACCSPI